MGGGEEKLNREVGGDLFLQTLLNSSPIDECGDGAWVYVEAASKRDR